MKDGVHGDLVESFTSQNLPVRISWRGHAHKEVSGVMYVLLRPYVRVCVVSGNPFNCLR